MRGHAGIQTSKHSRSSSRSQQELEPPAPITGSPCGATGTAPARYGKQRTGDYESAAGAAGAARGGKMWEWTTNAAPQAP
eukprot:gene20935-biopygen13153